MQNLYFGLLHNVWHVEAYIWLYFTVHSQYNIDNPPKQGLALQLAIIGHTFHSHRLLSADILCCLLAIQKPLPRISAYIYYVFHSYSLVTPLYNYRLILRFHIFDSRLPQLKIPLLCPAVANAPNRPVRVGTPFGALSNHTRIRTGNGCNFAPCLASFDTFINWRSPKLHKENG